jgi:hypothetical protein
MEVTVVTADRSEYKIATYVLAIFLHIFKYFNWYVMEANPSANVKYAVKYVVVTYDSDISCISHVHKR